MPLNDVLFFALHSSTDRLVLHSPPLNPGLTELESHRRQSFLLGLLPPLIVPSRTFLSLLQHQGVTWPPVMFCLNNKQNTWHDMTIFMQRMVFFFYLKESSFFFVLSTIYSFFLHFISFYFRITEWSGRPNCKWYRVRVKDFQGTEP